MDCLNNTYLDLDDLNFNGLAILTVYSSLISKAKSSS